MLLADFFTHGVVLVLWRVGAILGNECGIQGKNYAKCFRKMECKQGFTKGI